MNIELTNRKVIVVHSLDEYTGSYTFSLLEKGGPILIAQDFETGKAEFEEMMILAFSVRNLEYFDDISLRRNEMLTRNNLSGISNNFEYLSLESVA